MRKPTIYEALAERLQREPTPEELKAEVKRIMRETVEELAAQGRLKHPR